MGTIELFDHTADIGLIVRADDLGDLFRTAAEAMFDYIVVNRQDVLETEIEEVSITADSLHELMAEWLNELIFRSETRHRLYRRFDVEVQEGPWTVSGLIRGEPIDRDRHELDHEVKAVTRHGLSVGRDGSDWRAELILDI